MKKLLLGLLAALWAFPAAAQQTNMYWQTSGTTPCPSCFSPVSASNPLPISGSFSATLAGFAPGGTFATLTATGSSASVALPAGTAVALQNTGTTTVSCTLGVGSATALANEVQVPAGSTVFVTPGANTFGACIDQTGSASNLVVLAGGSGLGTGFGGGGGGGGGSVTQGTTPWVTALNTTPSLANGNGVVPTQGGTALSATNGMFDNILQGNAVLSATNGIYANLLVGNAAVATGAGATGSTSPRVTTAQDTTTVAGSAPGTAGSASANVVTVQGVASMTPVLDTPQATENHIGEVGSNGFPIINDMTTTNATTTTGQSIGGLQTLANAVRVSGSAGASGTSGYIQTINVTFTDAVGAGPLDVYYFNASPSGSTCTNDSAFILANADRDKVIGIVHVTDFTASNTAAVAQANNQSMLYTVASATSIFACVVARASFVITSTANASLVTRVVRN